MELKILNMQEHLHLYYFYLNDMANDIFHKQTEQKKEGSIFVSAMDTTSTFSFIIS